MENKLEKEQSASSLHKRKYAILFWVEYINCLYFSSSAEKTQLQNELYSEIKKTRATVVKYDIGEIRLSDETKQCIVRVFEKYIVGFVKEWLTTEHVASMTKI